MHILPPLQITFLGTGTSSGIPMIGCQCPVCASTNKKDKRLRSSILVQSPTTTLIVDTGPDFRYQMLRNNVSKLDAVLFTHAHKDHIAGLDDIRAFNYLLDKPMDVYATSATRVAIEREFYYAFAEKPHQGVPQFNLINIEPAPFIVGDIPVVPVLVWHFKMPVLGFRFGNFTYITDANRIDDAELEKIKGSTCIVLNALRKEKHLSHFTLSEAIEVAAKINAPATYLTHLSHQMGLHNEVSASLPPNVFISYDGLVLEL